MLPRPTRRLAFSASLLAGLPALHAQTVNWDGSGDANASGNWTLATNWAGDVAPSNTTVTAGLVNVSANSTRTISINSGETVTAKALAFTQNSTNASNILTVASGGTLNLGGAQTWAAPSANATNSTTTVNVGGTIDFTAITSGAVTVNTTLNLTNAGAVFRTSSGQPGIFNFNGAVTVTAGAGVAQIAATNTGQTMNSTFTSTLAVSSGTLEFSSAKINNSGNPSVTTTLQGSTTISSGASMRLIVTGSGSGSASVALANSGTLTQGGKVILNGRGGAGTSTITNSGNWIVSGVNAEIQKEINSGAAQTSNPTFTNSASGVFKGSSSADKLNYNHNADANSTINLAFTNSGVIAPGAGTSGSGLASVGTLTLNDFAITNTATASFNFDVGGASSGQFDVLALQDSAFSFTNATIAITFVNGFTPSSSFSLPIFTADGTSSVSGTIAGLTINGLANSDYAFSYNGTTGIGSLTFTSTTVPEPSASAALAALVGLAGAACRRRRRSTGEIAR